MTTVYVDNNATTRVAPEVLDEMLPYFSEYYGNPSSVHAFGGNVAKKIREAREKTAALIKASPEEIIFTSCGTESDNAAVRSALKSAPDKRHIVTSAVEHPAVLNLCTALEKEGYRVTYVPVDSKGNLDFDHFTQSLSDDTALVTVMWANNETGVVFPVKEIAEKAAEKGIPFHTDAVQAVGKIPVDIRELPVNMLSLSGHKIHAPKGVGALYVKKGTRFHPFVVGGHQESGRRGGTENVASIIGLGKASELAVDHLPRVDTDVRQMRDYLENTLLETVSFSSINGDRERRLPNTVSIGFDAIEGESILLHIDHAGICASSGSACTSGSLEPSHVLRAMDVPFKSAHGSIRFSLSVYNTMEEMEYIAETFPPIIRKLRLMSPFWDRCNDKA